MSKINRSWERSRNEVHSPVGVEELRKNIKYGLTRLYTGIAESMFRYDGIEDTKFQDMTVMSQDTAPEVFLFRNGQCVWFETAGQVHCLPLVMQGGVNIYGKMSSWHPVPVGWNETMRGQNSTVDDIVMRDLNYDNSVIMRNDLFGGSDAPYIESMVAELVDNVLTMNQLQLIAKSPFVFNVTEDNMLTAKNFFLAMCEDRPAIFTNSNGERPMPVVESTQMKIDPALFELYDRFECQILEYIGFPCVPITKRAQQSVGEVQSNDSKIFVRRMEKLNQRIKACERINNMFGTKLNVVSVVDELTDYEDPEEPETEAIV
jgi:hypothetical protein